MTCVFFFLDLQESDRNLFHLKLTQSGIVKENRTTAKCLGLFFTLMWGVAVVTETKRLEGCCYALPLLTLSRSLVLSHFILA